jgi:hypothetical protein
MAGEPRLGEPDPWPSKGPGGVQGLQAPRLLFSTWKSLAAVRGLATDTKIFSPPLISPKAVLSYKCKLTTSPLRHLPRTVKSTAGTLTWIISSML